MSLIDIDTAKMHLRVDGDEENDLIALYLAAAEASAVEFLNRDVYATREELILALDELGLMEEPPPDWADPILVNAPIRAAVLLILGHLYSNRENSLVGVSAQELPMGAHSLLWPYRVGLGV